MIEPGDYIYTSDFASERQFQAFRERAYEQGISVIPSEYDRALAAGVLYLPSGGLYLPSGGNYAYYGTFQVMVGMYAQDWESCQRRIYPEDVLGGDDV